MGNTAWSENIQGILNLDLSRELRFRDDRRELYLNLFGLKPGMTVVDVGCGPGTLTRKLSKWLGEESRIIGIDRDTAFINYARQRAADSFFNNMEYTEGDALKLPLEDNSVDACLSHTVIEHVPNREFLLEQKRVCRTGGRVSVIYTRPDKAIKTEPDATLLQGEREKELFEGLFSRTEETIEKHNVGKYWPEEVGLPKLFEELGFSKIYVDAIAVPVVVDDGRNSLEEKVAIIQGEKQQLLESLDTGLRLNPGGLTYEEQIELKDLISQRFGRRINLIQKGISLWDYTISIMQIVSGRVE